MKNMLKIGMLVISSLVSHAVMAPVTIAYTTPDEMKTIISTYLPLGAASDTEIIHRLDGALIQFDKISNMTDAEKLEATKAYDEGGVSYERYTLTNEDGTPWTPLQVHEVLDFLTTWKNQLS